MSKEFKSEDVSRLKQLVNEGCRVLQEVDDLKTGLSETIKSIAQELDVKPANLNRAIKIAHKRSFGDEKADLDEIEDILDIVGRKGDE
jgi:hypothetical protein